MNYPPRFERGAKYPCRRPSQLGSEARRPV